MKTDFCRAEPWPHQELISYTRTTKLEKKKKKTHWSSNPTSVIKAQQCISSSGSWNINSKIGADVWHEHHYQLLQKKSGSCYFKKKKTQISWVFWAEIWSPLLKGEDFPHTFPLDYNSKQIISTTIVNTHMNKSLQVRNMLITCLPRDLRSHTPHFKHLQKVFITSHIPVNITPRN